MQIRKSWSSDHEEFNWKCRFEKADPLTMKSLTEKADSCDLAVPRETGVERHFKTYLKEILNENADL